MLVCVDVDECCAALHASWLARYNEDYDDILTPEDITRWDIQKIVKPECGDKIFRYLDDPVILYQNVKPVEGALEGVRQIREAGHRVVFATSAPINHGGVKFEWLTEHGFFNGVDEPMKDYMEVRDKGMLRADVLVDDYFVNLNRFFGQKILFRRPHNKDIENKDFWPARTWIEVVRIMDFINTGRHKGEYGRRW